jgi:A/G-specific adenine glycosylase
VQKLAQQFGDAEAVSHLPEFTHVFTHFKLHITPVLVHLSQRQNMIAEARYVWFDMTKLENAPLPAPVKNILLSLSDRV